jgi:mannose-1-phosphate guanylyltransferase/mannose-6-phosphate isomerase
MIIPVILAGGSGTRLWPLSRELFPKQMLELINGSTLLQNTVRRLQTYPRMAEPIVICNKAHRFMAAEQLRAIEVTPQSIILEPVGRNTAPAVAVAALKAMKIAEDPILLVLPSDHYISRIDPLHAALSAAEHFARAGYLVTFGVVPNQPETGYGYIRMGDPLDDGSFKAASIAEFVEKPDRETAEKYLQSGRYFWNSGMFMFSGKRVLEEMEKFAPDILQACQKALEDSQHDLDFLRLNEAAFFACPSDSIDYAVMEKTRRGAVVPLDAGWNDIGSWEALWQMGRKDKDQNVVHGDVLIHDVRHSYLNAGSRLVAAVGLENHIVVETADAVLISPLSRVQDVKALVNKLKEEKRPEVFVHKRAYRPWGSSESMAAGERFEARRVIVKPGSKIDLQEHFHRAEHWVVVRGTALVIRGEEKMLLKEDESIYIPLGVRHRLENPGKIALELIEIRTGSYLGEDDIIRFSEEPTEPS